MSNLVTIRVLFFAALKELTRRDSLEMRIGEGSCVSELKEQLIERFPELEPLRSRILISVNHEFAQAEDMIPDGAEIGVFPAVSGGSGWTTVVTVGPEAFEMEKIVAAITTPETGAVCSFVGIIRGVTTRGEPYETMHLEYEAYLPMAEKKMAQIVEEIRQRWPEVQGVAVVQRIGRLIPLTPTVLIACAGSHRDSGVFEAARYGIDRLKEIVPVWKKEVGPAGEIWIEGDYMPERGD